MTGKCYIGFTGKTLSRRWYEHVSYSKHSWSPLSTAIKDFGKKVFTREVLKIVETIAEARSLEQQYVLKFDTFRNGYNQNMGGGGNQVYKPRIVKPKVLVIKSEKTYVMSKSSRQKMSEAKRGNSECAKHFGNYTKKGGHNPRSKSYLIKFPDGSKRIVRGMRAFIREYGLTSHIRCRGREKGFELLKTFNDYRESEYTQAGGNGTGSIESQDIVSSLSKDKAA